MPPRCSPGVPALRRYWSSAEVGVRETWRVEGDYVISHEDYVSGRKFNDAMCYAYYPVDLHSVEIICGARPRGGLHFCRDLAMFCEDICREA